MQVGDNSLTNLLLMTMQVNLVKKIKLVDLGRGILEIFCEKSRGPPPSQNGLIHDPSQIPTQKHLTLPPTPPRKK